MSSRGDYKEGVSYIVDILDASTGSTITSFELQKYNFILHQLEWFPDGTRITFIDSDQTLQIIEATTGRLLASYKLPESSEMICSPDCTYLAMTTEETTLLEIREVATGHVITSYSDPGHCIQWSPDSKYLAFALKEAIQVREALTGRLVASYTGHKDQVNSIAWHPSDTRIASSSNDGLIQVWEAMKGHHLTTHTRKSCQPVDLEWAPDGTQLLSSSHAATIQVVNRATGQASTIYCDNDAPMSTVVWSPDGTKIASGSGIGKIVQVWHARTGYHIATYTDEGYAWRIAWSPDSEQIASCYLNVKEVKVWHAETGRHLATYASNDHLKEAKTVAWSPNGKYIAIFCFDIAASWFEYKGTVEVWEVATKQLVTTYPMSDDSRDNHLASVSWSPDSTQIASGYGNFIVWSPDGKYIASNKRIEIHNSMTGGGLLRDYEPSNDNSSIHVWETRTGSSRIICQGTASVESAAWSLDGNYLATGHQDDIVRVWDLARDRVIAVHHGHISSHYGLGGVAWSPDGNYLAYTAESTEIQTYPGVS